jgi:hypothetical protein
MSCWVREDAAPGFACPGGRRLAMTMSVMVLMAVMVVFAGRKNRAYYSWDRK